MNENSRRRLEREVERIKQAIQRLRATCDSVDAALLLGNFVGTDVAQAVENAALNVSRGITRHDAFKIVEESSDVRAFTCSTCNDTHSMMLCDHRVPCTRCPLPCEKCRSKNPSGPYCAATPCPCECHRKEKAP